MLTRMLVISIKLSTIFYAFTLKIKSSWHTPYSSGKKHLRIVASVKSTEQHYNAINLNIVGCRKMR